MLQVPLLPKISGRGFVWCDTGCSCKWAPAIPSRQDMFPPNQEIHGATIQNRGLIFAPRVPKGVKRRRQPYQTDVCTDAFVCYFLAIREQ